TAATYHVFIAIHLHVSGQACPEQADGTAVPVIRMHAGAADFHRAVKQMRQPTEVELASRIVIPGFVRHGWTEDAVGANYLVAVAFANQQVVTEGIKSVTIITVAAGQTCPHFFGKYLVAQTLRLCDF